MSWERGEREVSQRPHGRTVCKARKFQHPASGLLLLTSPTTAGLQARAAVPFVDVCTMTHTTE